MSYQSDYSGAQVDEAVGKALNPDATPTQNSTNLVESGGVYDELASLRSVDDVIATNVKLVNGPIIKVKGGICYIYIQADTPSETLGSNWVQLFRVPQSVRPSAQIGCILAIYPYRNPVFARLKTDGYFELYNDQASFATSNQLNGFIAYPLT